eukprot:5405259-Pleurochrysis_carterae.AAC.1
MSRGGAHTGGRTRQHTARGCRSALRTLSPGTYGVASLRGPQTPSPNVPNTKGLLPLASRSYHGSQADDSHWSTARHR